MVTRVQKWGNSLAVRIPQSFAAEARVAAGTSVDIAVERGTLIVRPVPKRYRLNELLDEVTAKNIHSEVEIGKPVGREAW